MGKGKGRSRSSWRVLGGRLACLEFSCVCKTGVLMGCSVTSLKARARLIHVWTCPLRSRVSPLGVCIDAHTSGDFHISTGTRKAPTVVATGLACAMLGRLFVDSSFFLYPYRSSMVKLYLCQYQTRLISIYVLAEFSDGQAGATYSGNFRHHISAETYSMGR